MLLSPLPFAGRQSRVGGFHEPFEYQHQEDIRDDEDQGQHSGMGTEKVLTECGIQKRGDRDDIGGADDERDRKFFDGLDEHDQQRCRNSGLQRG